MVNNKNKMVFLIILTTLLTTSVWSGFFPGYPSASPTQPPGPNLCDIMPSFCNIEIPCSTWPSQESCAAASCHWDTSTKTCSETPPPIPSLTPLPITCFNLAQFDPQVCSGHGICVSQDTCVCEDGWTGSACEIENPTQCFGVPENDPTVCSGKGQCESQDQCVCNDDYSGSQCQTYSGTTCNGIPAGQDDVCNNNGQCVGQDECLCVEGYTGQFCETAIQCNGVDQGADGVCSNNGICLDDGTCSCNPGYEGTNCENEISPSPTPFPILCSPYPDPSERTIGGGVVPCELIVCDVDCIQEPACTWDTYQGCIHAQAPSPTPYVCEEGNIILNGGFETPAIPKGWRRITDGTPGLEWDVDWAVPRNGVPIIEYHHKVFGWKPYEGNQHIELASDAPSKIKQTLATVPGVNYAISFAYSPRPRTKANTNGLDINWGETLLDSLAEDGSKLKKTDWQYYTYIVTATNTSVDLVFEDKGKMDAVGTLLDHVVVTCLNEVPVDNCPDDPTKTEPGVCGCGVRDKDTDGDGTLDCNDLCPKDKNKVVPGVCGCGKKDKDTDGDGTLDCKDKCKRDPNKIKKGVCGCGVPDVDSDGDQTLDCKEDCPQDPNKVEEGQCGCGVPDTDSDQDGTADCNDECPDDVNKVKPQVCGCGVLDNDSDGDGTLDCNDQCPHDPEKIRVGQCGCGVSDRDSDRDGVPDCHDDCELDPYKITPGVCGCGESDIDSDEDGTSDCIDDCPDDPHKIEEGVCGCGVADTDSDEDGTADCEDGCPKDPEKIEEGICGCGVADTDTDEDGTADCHDLCPEDAGKVEPLVCGCGVPDINSDGDEALDCEEECPFDPHKLEPGVCGCGIADVDTDGDGVEDCIDVCPAIFNPGQEDFDEDGVGDLCDNDLICEQLSQAVNYLRGQRQIDPPGIFDDEKIIFEGDGFCPHLTKPNTLTLVDSNCQPLKNVRVNLLTNNGKYLTHKKTNAQGIVDFSSYEGRSVPGKFQVDYHGAKYATHNNSFLYGAHVQTEAYTMTIMGHTCSMLSNVRVNLLKGTGQYVTHKKTNGQGVASFEILPDASMKLQIDYHGGKWTSEANTADTDVLFGTHGYSVTLLSHQETPLSNVRVNLLKENGQYVTHTKTNKGGLAVFDVLQGVYHKLQPDYHGAKHTTEGSVHHYPETVQTYAFSLTFTGYDDAPLKGSRVNLLKANDQYVTHTKTDSQGVVVFDVLPGATMKLQIDYHGAKYASDAIVITQDTPISVKANLFGLNFYGYSQAPISGARVNLLKANDQYVTHTKTDQQGFAGFNVVPEATMKLQIDYHGAKYATEAVTVTEDVVMDVSAYAFTLAVTTSKGDPLYNARVNLLKANGQYVTHTKTGKDGKATFNVVPGATMKLQIDYHGAKYTTEAVTVNQNTEIAISTLALGTKVLDKNNNPVVGVRVNLLKENDQYVTHTKTDLEGVASFEVVPGSVMKLQILYNGHKLMRGPFVAVDSFFDVYQHVICDDLPKAVQYLEKEAPECVVRAPGEGKVLVLTSDCGFKKGVYVRLLDTEGNSIKRIKTNANGIADFSNVRTKKVPSHFKVEHLGGALVTEEGTFETGAVAQLESMTLTFLASSCVPLMNVPVKLLPEEGKKVAEKKTDLDGKVSFDVLPNVPYKFFVTYNKAAFTSEPRTSDYDVLVGAEKFNLFVYTHTGVPFVGLKAALRLENGKEVASRKTGPNGNVYYDVLPTVPHYYEVYHNKASFTTELSTDHYTQIVKTHSVSLTMWDPSENPIENVKVNLLTGKGKHVKHKKTDNEGTVAFEVLPNVLTTLKVEYRGETYYTETEEITENTHYDVMTIPYSVLVTSYDGEPLAKVPVNLLNGKGKGSGSTKTDGEGIAMFDVLPGATHSLKVTFNKGTYTTEQVVVTEPTQQSVQMLPVSLSLIDSNENPLAKVSVTLLDAKGKSAKTKKTDGEGIVIFNVLPGNTVSLKVAYNGGYYTTEQVEVNGPVKMHLQTTTYTVKFVDSRLNPIENAKFTLHNENGKKGQTLRTGEDGKVTFEVLPGAVVRAAVKMGKHQSSTSLVEVTEPVEVLHQMLVCGELGMPVTTIVRDDVGPCEVMQAPGTVKLVNSVCDPIPGVRVTLLTPEGDHIRGVKTDENGVADFTGYEGRKVPDHFKVTMRKVTYETAPRSFATGAVVRTHSYSLTLIGSDCEPVSGAKVKLLKGEGERVASLKTNEEGLAVFEALPGTEHGLSVEYRGGEWSSFHVDSFFDVFVGLEGFPMHVENSKGEPLVDIPVHLVDTTGKRRATIPTNFMGDSFFDVFTELPYSLEVVHNKGHYFTEVSTAHTLESVATIPFGLVLTDSTGEPLEEVRVTLRTSEDQFVKNKYTDEDGKVMYEILPGAQVKLRVHYNGADYDTEVYKVTEETLVELSTLRYVLELTDSDENPIENVPVRLAKANGNNVKMKETDEEGMAAFEVLPGATMKFKVRYHGHQYETGAVTVIRSMVVPVSTYAFSLLFTEYTGTPLEGVKVTLQKAKGGSVMSELTDEGGIASFEVLPGAHMKFKVHYYKATYETKPVVVEEPMQLTLSTIPFALEVSDHTEEPMADMTVDLLTEDDKKVTTKTTDREGVATFGVLPGAVHKLRARFHSFAYTTEPVVVVEPTVLGLQTNFFGVKLKNFERLPLVDELVKLLKPDNKFVAETTTDESGVGGFEVLPGMPAKLRAVINKANFDTEVVEVVENTIIDINKLHCDEMGYTIDYAKADRLDRCKKLNPGEHKLKLVDSDCNPVEGVEVALTINLGEIFPPFFPPFGPSGIPFPFPSEKDGDGEVEPNPSVGPQPADYYPFPFPPFFPGCMPSEFRCEMMCEEEVMEECYRYHDDDRDFRECEEEDIFEDCMDECMEEFEEEDDECREVIVTRMTDENGVADFSDLMEEIFGDFGPSEIPFPPFFLDKEGGEPQVDEKFFPFPFPFPPPVLFEMLMSVVDFEFEYKGDHYISKEGAFVNGVGVRLRKMHLNLQSSTCEGIEGSTVHLLSEGEEYNEEATTDENGDVFFDVLASAERVFKVDHYGGSVESELVTPKKKVTVGTEAYTLQVLDNNEEPLPHVRVDLLIGEGEKVGTTKTDASGLATFDVLDDVAHYRHIVHNGGVLPTPVSVDHGFETYSTFELGVTVLDTTSTPVEDARVNIVTGRGNAYVTNGRTNEDGFVSFQTLPGAVLALEVEYNGDSVLTKTTEMTEDTFHTVQLLSLTLEYVDSHGVGIEGAKVGLYNKADRFVQGDRTDEEGLVSFEVVPGAEVVMKVTYNGDTFATPLMTITEDTLVNVESLPGLSTVSYGLTITDSQGVPLPDLPVNLRKANHRFVAAEVTDENGTSLFEVVHGASMKLEVLYKGGRLSLGPHSVVEPTVVEVSLVSFGLNLTNMLGMPVEDGVVIFRDENSRFLGFEHTDVSGFASVEVLPGTSVKMQILAEGISMTTQPAVVSQTMVMPVTLESQVPRGGDL